MDSAYFISSQFSSMSYVLINDVLIGTCNFHAIEIICILSHIKILDDVMENSVYIFSHHQNAVDLCAYCSSPLFILKVIIISKLCYIS